MNFTKEYIKECDCVEIQKLKAKKGSSIAKMGYADWYFNRATKEISLFTYGTGKNLYPTWLPTGDQLDEEIRQVVQPKNWCYRFYFISYAIGSSYRANIMQTDLEFRHVNNPLLAKIKLLKQLLEEEK